MTPLSKQLSWLQRQDETSATEQILSEATLGDEQNQRIEAVAHRLVAAVRKRGSDLGGIDALLHEYSLSSEEGVVLMCLAEALLRIPDGHTADNLIRDQLGTGDWEEHIGQSNSLFVNASTWALMLTGRFVHLGDFNNLTPGAAIKRLIGRLGEPVIRTAVIQAMRILGHQFVMGQTIEEALKRSNQNQGVLCSFDMLGEAASTREDAQHYLQAYFTAIEAIGRGAEGGGPRKEHGISIKLSALHPRFEYPKRERLLKELTPDLIDLARAAKEAGIGITIDSEESDRLELTLELFEQIARSPGLSGWNGLGIAIQSYQKRAPAVIDWLAGLARETRHQFMVRLVKGAYWDSEIKLAQQLGLDYYPVFTRKVATDVSYIACARRLLITPQCFYPQFATHNAHTLATVRELTEGQPFEYQRLHGMGEVLYDELNAIDLPPSPCRVYAPVGNHADLLAYLVRRLLENGANTSFVNRILDQALPIDQIIANPTHKLRHCSPRYHPLIPLPGDLFGAERKNARGIDLSDPMVSAPLLASIERELKPAPPKEEGSRSPAEVEIVNPAHLEQVVGRIKETSSEEVAAAVDCSQAAFSEWSQRAAEERARMLEKTADLMEEEHQTLIGLAVREAGKVIPDALAEVREAVDFCRYYAARCRHDFTQPTQFNGPTGELNQLTLHGRGPFAAISPWNFPLAIFTGQVAAALAAGNTLLAKPAEQTPLIAQTAVALFHQAGIPKEVLLLLPGEGSTTGAALVNDPRIAGVAFTGSNQTASLINRSLAARPGPIVPLIAETGGQNAMVVDSSALPEQVVRDAIDSAFFSAGQRCSALRVLFLQSDTADTVLKMLSGAMEELTIGDPALLATDIGPIIDRPSVERLTAHAKRVEAEGKLHYFSPLGDGCDGGTFFAPHLFEIDSIDLLKKEVFGPILHVIRYSASHLDKVVEAINGTGYGLTAGVHSRVDSTIKALQQGLRVGNFYVNRNQVGATVGVQPFGGEGLSGTGPKAGGPHYLHRFATERTVTINTTARGGNTTLVTLEDETSAPQD